MAELNDNFESKSSNKETSLCEDVIELIHLHPSGGFANR